MEWSKLVFALIACLLLWLLYRGLRQNPEWLSKDNLNRSFRTMGIVALLLIAFVGFLIVLLRNL